MIADTSSTCRDGRFFGLDRRTYSGRHVLDHAHQAPRSGPLPRALGAVSNVLTGRASRSDDITAFDSRPMPAVPVRRACVSRATRREERHEPADRPAWAAVRRGRHQRRARRGAAHRARPARASLLLAAQAALFATAVRRAASSARRTPRCSAALVRPRLGPPAHLEDPAPPRFAQGVGLGFAAGRPRRLRRRAPTSSAWSPPALALVAALLNATFGFCLGCEIYLLGGAASDSAVPGSRSPPDPQLTAPPRQGAPP